MGIHFVLSLTIKTADSQHKFRPKVLALTPELRWNNGILCVWRSAPRTNLPRAQ